MNFSRQINLNTFSQLAGRGLTLIFSFLTTLFLRRLFGREIFGDYIFIFSIVMLLVTMTDFGTHLVSVKEAAQREKKQSLVLGNVLILRLAISLLAVLLGFITLRLFFQNQNIYYLSLLALPLIVLIAFKKTLLVVFHACQRIYLASLQDIMVAFLLFLVAWSLFWARGQLLTYIILAGLIYLVSNLPFSILAWRLGRPLLTLDWPMMKKLIAQSLPLGTILILYTIYSRLDTVILKLMWGSSSVGIYGLSYKIYDNLVLPAAFFMNAILPILSQKLLKVDKKQINQLLQKAAALLFAGSLIVAIAVFFTGPLIIRVFTGSFSLPEIISLWLLLLALPCAYLNHLTGYAIIVLSETKKCLSISAIALTFNLLANLIFVPFFSFKASAFITALTELLVLILSLKVIAKKLQFSFNYRSWPNIIGNFIKKKGRIFDDN